MTLFMDPLSLRKNSKEKSNTKTLAIAPDDDDSLLALLAKPIVPISKEER